MEAESIRMNVATVSRSPMIEDFIFISFRLIHKVTPIQDPHKYLLLGIILKHTAAQKAHVPKNTKRVLSIFAAF